MTGILTITINPAIDVNTTVVILDQFIRGDVMELKSLTNLQ